jgi:hypothetical protein
MKKLSFVFLLLISLSVYAQKFENLAQTPPMGWNSWNYFSCDGINEEVIAIDQDSLGITAHKAIDEGQFEVYEKKLTNEAISYCFFNRTDQTMDMKFDWTRLGLRKTYKIRDLWKHEYIGTTEEILSKKLERHGILHVKLIPEGK